MSEARYDLGLVEAVKAEALGEPGQRHFRLLVSGLWGEACLWLEKEQLLHLSLAIRQLLTMLPTEVIPERAPHREMGAMYPDRTSIDFKVGKLSLGHEPGEGLFQVQAHNAEDDPNGKPLLEFWASQRQLEGLAEEAQAVCAAGRPRCPICTGPIGSGPHVCPRSNGHHPL